MTTSTMTEPDLMPWDATEPQPAPCERWRAVWRQGLAPLLSTVELLALRDALAGDDPALIQGMTTPPASTVKSAMHLTIEGACLLGYAGWKARGMHTVPEVEEYFTRLCWECDRRCGDLKASYDFLNTYDGWPRGQMRFELLPEVLAELARRGQP